MLLWSLICCACTVAGSAWGAGLNSLQTANATENGTSPAVTRLLHVSSTQVNFGEVTLTSAPTQVVTLTSVGTGNVTLNAARLSGAEFRIAGASVPITLRPAQSTTLRIQFVAKLLGTANGQLTISSNATQAPVATVALLGNGTTAQVPQLSESAAALSFGEVTVGTPTTQTLTLSSLGTLPVTVKSAAATGTGFKLLTGGFPMTLSPTKTVTLRVQFAPTAVQQEQGQLVITSDSTAGSVVSVPLSGTSTRETNPQLSLSAMSLVFGSAPVGSSAQQAVTLTSTGTEPVTVHSLSASGAGFQLAEAQFPLVLNPKQTALVEVEFSPVETGQVTGQLRVVSDARSTGVTTVGLTGSGTSAALAQMSSSASALNFGNVEVNGTATQRLTLTSTGTLPLKLDSAAIAGAGYKLLAGTLPITLPAGESTTVEVEFTPTAAGTVPGHLTIVSDAVNDASLVVGLNGSGTLAGHKVDLTWSAPASSSDPVSGYNVYRSTSGQAAQKIGSESKSTTSYIDSSVKDGSTYTYTVKSYDAEAAESKASNVTTVTIP